MQVFTYYTRLSIPGFLGPLKVVKNHHDQMAVLKLWEKTWRNNGWEPVVLGEDDALAADENLARRIMNAKNLYRSPNPKAYEMACYLRWVAMTTHGGLMTDYDVINQNFRPEDLEGYISRYGAEKPLFLVDGACPCAVYGTAESVRQLVEMLLEFESAPHTQTDALKSNISDQHIFGFYEDRLNYCSPSPCVFYPKEKWETAPLIHFSHSGLRRKRGQTIKRLLRI